MRDDAQFDDDGPVDSGQPLSPGRRAAAVAVAALLVTGAGYAMVRVSSPPVRPKQEAPQPHWGPACAACHLVSESAKPIEVKK